MLKLCTKCGEEKQISQFNADKRLKSGVRSSCRDCDKAHQKSFRENNKELIRARNAAWYAENTEYAKRKQKEYRDANPEWWAERNKKWASENPEKKSNSDRAWREANVERCRENARAWIERNYDQWLKIIRKANDKRLSTPKGRIESNTRRAVSRSIGNLKSSRTFDILGYTVDELMAHLEHQFQPGMTWENYGEWHIDHIIPLSAHNYETPDDIDFKRAWALSNLQPLWAEDNIKKGPRFDCAFQPSLALAVNDNKPTGGKKEEAHE